MLVFTPFAESDSQARLSQVNHNSWPLVTASIQEYRSPSSELKREQAWSRIHLVPLILAEQDRDAYRRNQAALAREKEIMKDVPNWEVSTVVFSFPSSG